jgi:hypothetical protein
MSRRRAPVQVAAVQVEHRAQVRAVVALLAAPAVLVERVVAGVVRLRRTLARRSLAVAWASTQKVPRRRLADLPTGNQRRRR